MKVKDIQYVLEFFQSVKKCTSDMFNIKHIFKKCTDMLPESYTPTAPRRRLPYLIMTGA